jgi:predicted metal-dependent phosphoesterase TrpH
MTSKIIDLQIHTTGSDGVFAPAQIVKKAKENKVAAIAITDHDSVAGMSEGLVAGKRLGIEVVPGIELTCYQKKEEYHLLGYYFDWQDKDLAKKIVFYKEVRKLRAKKVVAKLQALGFFVTYEEVSHLAKEAILRPHFVRAVNANPKNHQRLVQEFGRIPSISQFIRTYIVPGKPAYVEKPGFAPLGAIKLIHRLGGLAILSHPGYTIKIGDEEKLKGFIKDGLDGLEVVYPYHPNNLKKTRRMVNYFDKVADRFRLLKTGGSDYHGRRENEVEIGLINFPLEVPYQLLEGLKKRLNLRE